MDRKSLEPSNGSKCPINLLSNPNSPKMVVTPSESGSDIIEVDQAQVVNELSKLFGVNSIHILSVFYLLMGPHNIVKIPSDERR